MGMYQKDCQGQGAEKRFGDEAQAEGGEAEDDPASCSAGSESPETTPHDNAELEPDSVSSRRHRLLLIPLLESGFGGGGSGCLPLLEFAHLPGGHDSFKINLKFKI